MTERQCQRIGSHRYSKVFGSYSLKKTASPKKKQDAIGKPMLLDFFFLKYDEVTGSPAAPRSTARLGPRQEGEIRKRIGTPTTAETTNLNSCDAIRHVPEIKLIRTDTTLDLSQKAEKV